MASTIPPGSRRIVHPLASGFPPRWASEWGQDRHAPWCAFTIGKATQRLRWIPPGRFTMGSPEGEVGRFRDDREGPQNEVVINEGFWMFSTPCTQALWKAVMDGANPSRFQSDDRPVENVTWDDCQQFVAGLNDRLGGHLELALPSEAQWEYACWAGTTTATYAGDLEIKGRNNAPILDEIAWYGGNCGVDFELENGWDTTDEDLWKEKQYEFTTGGTHPVALKKPNRWGLFDMLGNVWEWCADPWRSSYDQPVPSDAASANRVLRGGSWRNDAGSVRAACRIRGHPTLRIGPLGFRCVEFRQGELSQRVR